MKDAFDVIVVGSGAGGGVVAGELAERGRDVLLLETGPHLTAADFTRWEAKATHDMWWPLRLAPAGEAGLVAFLAGRCVGGTTTINTKVALRAHDKDVAKWQPATGLTKEDGAAFIAADLDPYYDRVEARLGVRERTDWRKSVYTLEPGFRALGAELEPVRSYTDPNCMSCGSCLQGCPTNAGKSTMNTYIHDALAARSLELRANANVERILIEGGEATGVEYVDADGTCHTVHAGAVVVAAGSLNTPQLLLRSGMTGEAIGRNLGLHPVRLVYGLFDEPQDAHMVYPITASAKAHQHDEDGGFVIEATTIQDPISFRDDALRRAGADVGQAPRRGGAEVPPLERRARDGQRRQLVRRLARRRRQRAVHRRLPAAGARAARRRAPVLEGRPPGRGRLADRVDGARLDARAGLMPDGR